MHPHCRERKRRQRRHRERHKTIVLISENSAFARAFYILVHFFVVPAKQQRQMIKL